MHVLGFRMCCPLYCSELVNYSLRLGEELGTTGCIDGHCRAVTWAGGTGARRLLTRSVQYAWFTCPLVQPLPRYSAPLSLHFPYAHLNFQLAKFQLWRVLQFMCLPAVHIPTRSAHASEHCTCLPALQHGMV